MATETHVSDSTDQTPENETAAAKETPVSSSPRVWPAVVIVALQLGLIFVPAMVVPGTFAHFMGVMWGPVVGAVLLLIWWLFLSRVSWQNRLVGLGLFIGTAIGTWFSIHETMKIAIIFYILPSVTSAIVASLVAFGFVGWPTRRWLTVATMIVIPAIWTVFRLDGLTGAFGPDFSLRWSQTEEDIFLAETKSKSSNTSDAFLIPTEASNNDWPMFRGPRQDGIVYGVEFATDWDNNPPREIWRRRVGPGWSSFTVIGDALFTQEQRGTDEVVVCYNAETGEEVWANTIEARFEETVGGAGPRATPTFHDGKLYTMGATAVLQSIDPQTGKTIWQRDVAEETGAKTPPWGFSSSPLIVHENVIVYAGAEGDKSVVAYDRSTGEPAWTSGKGKHSYSSAHLANIHSVEQVLMATDFGLQSLSPDDGNIMWQYDWTMEGMARIVQPLVIGNDVVIGTGYGAGTRRISVHRDDDKWTTEDGWETNRLKPYFNDFVLHNGHLYGFDGRMFTCIDVESGQQKWKTRGYEHGQVLLVADSEALVVTTEHTGEVVLVKATPDRHNELGRIKALDGKTWNHPVVAHGKLFVRNGKEAVCYELVRAGE